ncbi:MAG: YkgJ family cysteine cluster protein [Candidatus Eremiobacteraeota bacterium]|nr:YkgJ family cysteine cluster protein [Candidatus Eremiobacteraeota bacterium]MCW5871230.1 YkgJ family cysteine cluster protein [Candidatus Eremiobacteraeota bacterium]
MNRAFRKRLQRLADSPPAISHATELQATVDTLYAQQYLRTLAILQTLTSDNASSVAKNLAEALRQASDQAQQTAARLYPQAIQPIQCRSGCSWCCYEQLQVHILDAVAVAASLSSPLDYRLETRDSHEIRRIFRPCPFLSEEQTCTVYKHRPLPCRAHHSVDAERCRQAVENQDPERQVPMHIRYYSFPGLPQEATLKVFEEMGIDHRPVVLGLAVAALTRDFEKITADWLSGGPAFEECIVLNC